MKHLLLDFTIVSITYNNDGIFNTIQSTRLLRESGSKMIIQNGGNPLSLSENNIKIFNEPDNGIYNALNKGISKVITRYFMLLHAGDLFIGTPNDIIEILTGLENSHCSISLNSQYIGNRLHSSSFWRPWMLHFGAQPPHLPCVYKTIDFIDKTYSQDVPIIADFHFFLKEISWKNAKWNNKVIVKMEIGGATSNGFQSFLNVSRLFFKTYGFKGLIYALGRVPIKIIQSIF